MPLPFTRKAIRYLVNNAKLAKLQNIQPQPHVLYLVDYLKELLCHTSFFKVFRQVAGYSEVSAKVLMFRMMHDYVGLLDTGSTSEIVRVTR